MAGSLLEKVPRAGIDPRTPLRHLRRGGAAYARVALADKLYNARAILADHVELGVQLWPRFNADKEEQLW